MIDQSDKWLARRERIRKNRDIGADQPIGIVGCVCKSLAPTSNSRIKTVYATTQDIDLDDEVVVAAGADTSYFFKNGAIFIEHSGEITDKVGVLRSPTPFPSNADIQGWKIGIEFLNTPLANDILEMSNVGGLAVSIGFIPIDAGKPTAEEVERYGKGRKFRSIVRRWKWLETSVVGMPCNVSCQSSAMAFDSSKSSIILDLVTKGRIQQTTAARLGIQPKTVTRIVCRA